MKGLVKILFTSGFILFLKVNAVFSQTVDATPENQNICFGATANLSATYTGPVATSTTSYAISSIAYSPDSYSTGTVASEGDDTQAGPFPIGFNFCFFGNTYSQFYIGSNGWVAFTSQPTTYTSSTIPSTSASVPQNCIMGPWQDWYPGLGTNCVRYQTYGVAPNRRLVVSWNASPMFSCTSTLGTFQITIHETTNIIENFLANKPNCTSWAGGTAVQGLHNAGGTVAYVVPGRNSTQWTATNEGWRYTPNGPATSSINWYILPANTLVGTGTSITVTPPPCQVNTSYYAQVVTTGTCLSGFGTDTVVVTQINCTPCIVTAGNNGPICAGSTLNLTATTVAGGTYMWTGPNGFTSTLQNPTIPSATTLASGTYTVVVTQAATCNSCTVTTSVVVNAVPPAPTASNNGPVCTGSSILLGCLPGTAGATYNWTGPGGFTSSLQNPTIPSATAANGGIYSVTMTISGCTSPAGTTTVIVKPTPTTPTATGTTPICEGGTITLTTPNVAGASWVWAGPNSFSSIVRNPPPITGALPIASGTYSVTITVNGCTSAPGTVNIVVNPTPAAPTVSNVSICFGTSATLTATTSGPTYEWYDAPTGGTLLGTGATFTTPTLTTTTTYYVQSDAAGGCIGPRTSVTVTVTPNITVNAGLDDSICSGGSYTLGVVSPLGAGYNYSWDAPASAGFSTSAAPSISPAATTTYTLNVTDAIGCSGQDMVTITVGTPLTVNATGTPDNCSGSCDGTGTVIAGGSFPAYSYSWSNGSTTPSINSLCAGTYTINVTDILGCSAQDTIQIVEPTAISLTTSSVTSHCSLPDGSATVTATGGAGGYTYLWSPSGQTTATAINLTPGLYCATVTDANGCTANMCITVTNTPGVSAVISTFSAVTCNGLCNGSATISPTGGVLPYNYLWSNGQTTPTVTGLCAGIYTCTVHDGSACSSSATVTITEPSVISVNTIAPVTICIGQSTTLTAVATGGHSSGGYTYNWNAPAFTGASNPVSPAVTTTYSVTATDTAGCISPIQTVMVTVHTPLSIAASNNVSICPGASTNLTSVASGGDGTYTYNWMPGAGTGSSFSVSPAATTTYTVTLNDGCTTLPAMDTVTVTVLPVPSVAFNSNLTSGCAPLCVNFNDLTTVTGGTAASWNWNFGTGASNLQNPTNCFESAGTYNVTLTVTSNAGCVATSTISNMITVYPQPVAEFTLDPQPASLAAPTINFTDMSVSAQSWAWDFGDPNNINGGNTSNLSDPSHTYADTGTYCVTLIVTSNSSCASPVTHCLYINPEYTFYIPNAFTPNGDGMNEVFKPKGEYIEDFTMRIFDRWGQMLFMSTDFNKGWNGTVKTTGEVAQEDVYVYIIDIKDKVGQKHQYIGHVTIVK